MRKDEVCEAVEEEEGDFSTGKIRVI